MSWSNRYRLPTLLFNTVWCRPCHVDQIGNDDQK
jgi:hypothetical protein